MTITAHSLKCVILQLNDEFDSYANEKEEMEAAFNKLRARVIEVKELAHQYAGIDGGHHKQWLIDKMLRKLLADDYQSFVEEYNSYAPSAIPDEVWDEGIAP